MEKFVKIWLIIGVILVLFQIVIGGVTRLTGSGLSITKWEIIIGTFPPTGTEEWNEAFDLYKETPQYQKINKGMSLSEFKFIYFWEYFHRLWARMMGLIFLIPFIFFVWKKALDKTTIRGLGVVVLFAAFAAIFGWIMVASGLIDRPWVNAYKLSLHLSLGVAVFGALLWVTFKQFQFDKLLVDKRFRKFSISLFALICIQLFLGGIMSGTKAGLLHATWPRIGSEIIPQVLFHANEWNVDNFVNYENGSFFPALIHFLHRSVAYIIFGLGLYYVYTYMRFELTNVQKWAIGIFGTLLITQVLLGIITLINCIGTIPVLLGSLHQVFGVLLFGSMLFLTFLQRQK